MSANLLLGDLRAMSRARVREGARGPSPRLQEASERWRQPYEDMGRMKGVATTLRSDGKALGKSINPDAATAGQRR